MQGYREQICEFLRSKKRISRMNRTLAEFFINHQETVVFLTLMVPLINNECQPKNNFMHINGIWF